MIKFICLATSMVWANGSLAAENCWQLGVEQIALAHEARITEAERKAAYQKAQEHFICAAQLRVAEAGLRAADLGEKGLARKLDPTTAQRYYAAASLGGNKAASFAMARLVCGGDTNNCTAPLEASKWIIKAARQGSEDAPQALAIFLETGEGGVMDIKRAAACYKLAEERGNQWARQNYLRLHQPSADSADCLGE